MPMVEPMEEDEEVDKEVDVGEPPPTGDLVPEQVLALLATLLAEARIWADVPGDQMAG